MKENKVIIFGPWCGEFSYELSWWNPEIRKIRNENFKNWHAVHIGFKGRRAMYKDFIDDYIPYPKELENTLRYPAAGGEHVIDVGEIIPNQLKDFMYKIAESYQEKYDEVELHMSDPTMFYGGNRIYDEEPYGEYINYEIDPKLYQETKNKIKNYPHFTLISDDGFQALVHTNNFGHVDKKVNAILIYDNDGNGDGKYGKPVSAIYGYAYNKTKDMFVGGK